MKNYKYILFDFDGTIADTSPGIINGVYIALNSFGIKVDNPAASLKRFIGPPLSYSFNTFYGLQGDDITKAISIFREYYTAKGSFECTMYDGMDKVLKELKQKNKHVILATSKLTFFATRMLENLNIRQYFDFISGAELDKTREEKPEVLEYAIKQYGIDVSQAVMIGDRIYDIQGALSFGMDSIGVLYGFGEEKEFKGAVAIAKDTEELGKLLLME